MDLVHLAALWLHTVAFVIPWGYYGVLGRMIMPGLARSLDQPRQATALAAIERRALPLIGLSLVLFMLTGTYLLFADPQYAGLGNVRASAWTTLMLLKHLAVFALIGVGAAVDFLIRVAADADEDDERTRMLRYTRWSAEGATVLGALIALLTGAAQLSA
jgi:uncharacterized membrane protein